MESKLTAALAAPNNFFGARVAVRGRTAVVGAHQKESSQIIAGAGVAYVFDYNGSKWAETARLVASDGVNGDQFGSAVAIGDNTIVIGAEGECDCVNDANCAISTGPCRVQKREATDLGIAATVKL